MSIAFIIFIVAEVYAFFCHFCLIPPFFFSLSYQHIYFISLGDVEVLSMAMKKNLAALYTFCHHQLFKQLDVYDDMAVKV